MENPIDKLKIAIDGGTDLPKGWMSEFKIRMIPINILFGEKTYLQGVELSDQEFYQMAREGGTFPKTSQPSPLQFIQFYRSIASPGDQILSLNISSKLSGTLSSALVAAKELMDEIPIHVVDTKSGSAAVAFMAREARLMDRAGAGLDEIIRRMEWMASQVQIILTLKTLDFAWRSGRVKALQAALASLLDVKPIIILKNGMLEVGDKVRTRRRALQYVVDEMARRLGDMPVRAAVVNAQDSRSGEILKAAVQEKLNCIEVIATELSIGVAANLGPGTVGLVTFPVKESL